MALGFGFDRAMKAEHDTAQDSVLAPRWVAMAVAVATGLCAAAALGQLHPPIVTARYLSAAAVAVGIGGCIAGLLRIGASAARTAAVAIAVELCWTVMFGAYSAWSAAALHLREQGFPSMLFHDIADGARCGAVLAVASGAAVWIVGQGRAAQGVLCLWLGGMSVLAMLWAGSSSDWMLLRIALGVLALATLGAHRYLHGRGGAARAARAVLTAALILGLLFELVGYLLRGSIPG